MEERWWKGVKMWSIGHQHSAWVIARRDRLYFSDLQKCISRCHVHIHLIQLNVHICLFHWTVFLSLSLVNISQLEWCIWHWQCSVGVRVRRGGLYFSNLVNCISLILLNVFVSFSELYFVHFHNWISLSLSCASGTGSAVWGWEPGGADSISQFPLSPIQKGEDDFLERKKHDKTKLTKTEVCWNL